MFVSFWRPLPRILSVLTLSASAMAADNPTTPNPAAASLLEERCSNCHESAVVKNKHLPRAQWEGILSRMRGYGAQLSDDEADQLLEYLSALYGMAP